MFTRSQAKKVTLVEYEVDIDFDEASEAWKKNKKRLENGNYRYICGYDTHKGNQCQNKPSILSINGYCSKHESREKK